MTTPFREVLREIVEQTPGAIGGAFAASDGEMVDSFTSGDPTEWALLTAHYGVVLRNLEAALGSLHFGSTEYFVIDNTRLEILIYAVAAGYYALLALEQPAPLAKALTSMRAVAAQLQREMA